MTIYSDKLKDPRWQKKRLEILERDKWKCKSCGDISTTLNVHHLFYFNGVDPWDIPNGFLITLCEDCHKEESNHKVNDNESILFDLSQIFNYILAAGFNLPDLPDISQAFYNIQRIKGPIQYLEINQKEYKNGQSSN